MRNAKHFESGQAESGQSKSRSISNLANPLLFRFNSTNRASTLASTAAYTLIGIDLELAVAHADSAYRALSFTGSAADACIFDNICHN